MKVLHLCPLWYPVARDSPGGIETFLPALLSELSRLGCQSTIMASADSQVDARVQAVIDVNVVAQMQHDTIWEYLPYELHEVLAAIEAGQGYDVVHSHLGFSGYLLSAIDGVRDRVLHTQHNPVTQDVEWFVERHPELLLSVVSEFQAAKLRRRGARRCHVIPNGIDVSQFALRREPGRGLVFLGTIMRHKGPDIAVRVARELGLPLTLAGPLPTPEVEFFEQEVRPGLDREITYVGPVGHADKVRLLGGASCVLMPSRWEEPFGLVAVEAMACGTPVVALARGGLPEVIEAGRNGYLAREEGELAALVAPAVQLDRADVRDSVSPRFEMATVARRYVELYERIAAG